MRCLIVHVVLDVVRSAVPYRLRHVQVADVLRQEGAEIFHHQLLVGLIGQLPEQIDREPGCDDVLGRERQLADDGDGHGLATTIDEFVSYWPERHVDGALEDCVPDRRLVGHRKDPVASALTDAC